MDFDTYFKSGYSAVVSILEKTAQQQKEGGALDALSQDVLEAAITKLHAGPKVLPPAETPEFASAVFRGSAEGSKTLGDGLEALIEAAKNKAIALRDSSRAKIMAAEKALASDPLLAMYAGGGAALGGVGVGTGLASLLKKSRKP